MNVHAACWRGIEAFGHLALLEHVSAGALQRGAQVRASIVSICRF